MGDILREVLLKLCKFSPRNICCCSCVLESCSWVSGYGQHVPVGHIEQASSPVGSSRSVCTVGICTVNSHVTQTACPLNQLVVLRLLWSSSHHPHQQQVRFCACFSCDSPAARYRAELWARTAQLCWTLVTARTCPTCWGYFIG